MGTKYTVLGFVVAFLTGVGLGSKTPVPPEPEPVPQSEVVTLSNQTYSVELVHSAIPYAD